MNLLGTWRTNVVVGSITFLIVLFGNLQVNVWVTSLIRSLFWAVIVFLLTYMFRWLFAVALASNPRVEGEQRSLTNDESQGDVLVEENVNKSEVERETPEQAAAYVKD
ncbi:hypothetical protein [Halalkalibacterium halodurans]|jgi:hypothetical protein|uniref:Uncharacterized protein n=1 Tax=Halalkalibacterium halodurans TaxID=86665 RepID=A0A0M0KJ40_ALKHA|nr:hypothetical protein [Halalkalibacterium halodurans]TES56886.1 hypothetical protein E2L07_03385 [Halalkalibacterium halodurans]TPE69612.1 hypothetical protein AMD02_007505 [Halalkalibacterium halodurans]